MESELSDRDNVNPNVIQDQDQAENQMSILDLNDYCLLQVFRHLNVYDSINFGGTCKLLQKMSQMAMTKHKKLVLSDYETEYSPNLSQPIPLAKMLPYVAPHIELLDTTRSVPRRHAFRLPQSPKVSEPLQTIVLFEFPKLKTLLLQDSKDLNYINNDRNVEKLTISQINSSDLVHYVSGMAKLTQLCLPGNSQPESPIEFSEDFFTKLPHLKYLHLPRVNIQHLEYILQIQQLSELSFEVEITDHQVENFHRVDMFLKKLAEKNTVQTLGVRGVDPNSDSLFDSLASMNLISLRILPSSINITTATNFFSRLANTPFTTLKDLELLHAGTINDVILIIKRLKTLKRFAFFNVKNFDLNVLLEQINQLLKVTTSARPDLEVELLLPGDIITVLTEHNYFFCILN